MLKNYTSTVPADRSVSRIESLLVYNGATDIMKRYNKEKRRLEAISFSIRVEGREVYFKLPARIEAVEQILNAKVRRRSPTTAQKSREQAERTAWKIICEWVEVEMALIELRQRTMMEVFLPCLYDVAKDQTFFEKLDQAKFKGLLPEKT